MSATHAFAAHLRLNLKSGEDRESCLNFLETIDATPTDKIYCLEMLNRWITYGIFTGTYTVQLRSAIPLEIGAETFTAQQTSAIPSQIELEIMRVAMAGIAFCKGKIDNQDSEEDTDSDCA